MKLPLSVLTLIALAIGAAPASASQAEGGQVDDFVGDTVYGVHLNDLDVGESVQFDRLELVPHVEGIGHALLPTTATVYRVSATCLHGGQFSYPYKSNGKAVGWLEATTTSGCSTNNQAETETRFCEADSQTCAFGWYSVKVVSAYPGSTQGAYHTKVCASSAYREWTQLGWTPTNPNKVKKTMEIACNI